MSDLHDFEIGLYCPIPQPDDIWIITKYIQDDRVYSKRLTKKEYDKHFNVVNNFHKRMIESGYKVSEKASKMLETFFEDNIMSSYSYFVGVCDNPEHADECIKWICNLREIMNEKGYTHPIEFCFNAPDLYELVKAVIDKKITPTMGKEVLRLMSDRKILTECLEMDKFKVASDNDLEKWVNEIIQKNPEQVEKAKVDPKMINWLIGQIMKESKGKGNAAAAKELLTLKIGL